MHSRLSVVLALLLAFTLSAGAQSGGSDPQPLPLPNSPALAGSDPNDSGYTSTYLLNYDWTKADGSVDDPFLRLEANRQRRGTNPNFVGDMLKQAEQERALNPQLLPGAAPAPGIPVWFNMGPTKSNHIQNGVLLTVVVDAPAPFCPIPPTRISFTSSLLPAGFG